MVRTDIGSEDISTELTDFLDAKGTVHQRTVPYSPETNGAAERLKQTLPASKYATLRTLLAFAATENFEVHQLDI